VTPERSRQQHTKPLRSNSSIPDMSRITRVVLHSRYLAKSLILILVSLLLSIKSDIITHCSLVSSNRSARYFIGRAAFLKNSASRCDYFESSTIYSTAVNKSSFLVILFLVSMTFLFLHWFVSRCKEKKRLCHFVAQAENKYLFFV
jgi:hypothetical protein